MLFEICTDGVHFFCENVSSLTKNSYGYNTLVKVGSLRFSIDNDKTIIRMNKDNKNQSKIKPDFIIVVGELTDELLEIANKKSVPIVEVVNEW